MIYKKKIRPVQRISPAVLALPLGPNAHVEYAKMLNVYEGAMKEVGTMLEILDAEFQTDHDHNPIHHMESRIKSVDSILDKLHRKNLEPTLKNIADHIHDIVGLRIICPYIEDIYHLTDLLCRQDRITLVRKTDYIAEPKRNGYRSMHLVVKVPVYLSDRVEQVPVEIQLRTIGMDMWASLEHELHYKSSHQPVEHLSERLRRCAVSLADIDLRMQEIYDHLSGKGEPEQELEA